MPPRVKYLGQRSEGDQVWHDYADDRGGKFSVPDKVAPAPLPAAYVDELGRGFEALKHGGPDVLEAERQRYNAEATRSQSNPTTPAGAVAALEPDDLGRSYVRLPQARPFDQIPEGRYLGPTPDGRDLTTALGAPAPQVTMVSATNRPDVEHHEGIHAAGLQPGPEAARMGAREREQYRVFKTLNQTNRPDFEPGDPDDKSHRPHDLISEGERLQAALAELRSRLGL